MPTVTPISQSLDLIFIKNVSADGKTTYETRRFRNVKVTALPEDILEVGQAIAKVSHGDMSAVRTTGVDELTA